MAWSIEKTRPRVERRGWRLRLVRYEGSWIVSSYGAFWFTAATHKSAVRKMLVEQGKMFGGS